MNDCRLNIYYLVLTKYKFYLDFFMVSEAMDEFNIDLYIFMVSETMDEVNEGPISIHNDGLANHHDLCSSSASDISYSQVVTNSHSDTKFIGEEVAIPINEQSYLQRQSFISNEQSYLQRKTLINSEVRECFGGHEYYKYLSHNHSLYSISENTIVILGDTGASSCMFPMKDVFRTLEYYPLPQPRVFFGDRRSVPMFGYGSTSISDIAYYVPDLKIGVIAISYYDDKGLTTTIKNGKMRVYNEYNNDETLLLFTKRNKLYTLDENYVKILYNTQDINTINDVDIINDSIYSFNMNDNIQNNELLFQLKNARYKSGFRNILKQLHDRLGHPSESIIKIAIRDGLVNTKIKYSQVKDITLPLCTNCMFGRMKAIPSNPMTNTEYDIFEKVGFDFKYVPIKSRRGNRGFFLFYCKKSRWYYIHPVSKKKYILNAIKGFYLYHRDKIEREVIVNGIKSIVYITKFFQCDSEIINIQNEVAEFINGRGARFSNSAPYKHSTNGLIESPMGILNDKARINQSVYECALNLWDYNFTTTVYLLNHTPSMSNPGHKSPLEMVYDIKPNWDALIPYGCPGIYHVTKEERQVNKLFAYKGRICRYMGMRIDGSGYDVLDIQSNCVIPRQDVVFDSTLLKEYFKEDFKFDDTDLSDCIDNDGNYIKPINQHNEKKRKLSNNRELKNLLSNIKNEPNEFLKYNTNEDDVPPIIYYDSDDDDDNNYNHSNSKINFKTENYNYTHFSSSNIEKENLNITDTLLQNTLHFFLKIKEYSVLIIMMIGIIMKIK